MNSLRRSDGIRRASSGNMKNSGGRREISFYGRREQDIISWKISSLRSHQLKEHLPNNHKPFRRNVDFKICPTWLLLSTCYRWQIAWSKEPNRWVGTQERPRHLVYLVVDKLAILPKFRLYPWIPRKEKGKRLRWSPPMTIPRPSMLREQELI